MDKYRLTFLRNLDLNNIGLVSIELVSVIKGLVSKDCFVISMLGTRR